MVDELDKKLNANQDKRRPMRYLVWRMITSLGYLLGALFILLGLYVYLYYETNWIGQIGLAFYPYRNYALPLLIGGIALLIVGYVTEQRERNRIK